WKKIIKDKETVFMIQKLWRESEIEVKKAFKTDLFKDYQNNQKLVFNTGNRTILDQLKQEAGMGEIKDWDLDYEVLRKIGVKLDFLEY
ncbi:hypothetical protein ACFL24_02750, partial [Patescibacteria group bacterium]